MHKGFFYFFMTVLIIGLALYFGSSVTADEITIKQDENGIVVDAEAVQTVRRVGAWMIFIGGGIAAVMSIIMMSKTKKMELTLNGFGKKMAKRP